MSLTQGGGPLPPASVVPAFQGDVNDMRQFISTMKGQKIAPGAFEASPGMTSAANFGNNFFGGGGTGSIGTGALNHILSGANLDPSSNPYLQGNINAMQHAFSQTLGQGEDSLNAQFQMAGQTGANSTARNNAMTKFATGATRDFGDTMSNFMGQNYQFGQNQIMQGLGMMDQPLSAAHLSSALGQAPGQEAYQGQMAQNQLSEMPFDLMMELMKNTPISNPSYAPSEPSDLANWMNMGSQMLPGLTSIAGLLL